MQLDERRVAMSTWRDIVLAVRNCRDRVSFFITEDKIEVNRVETIPLDNEKTRRFLRKRAKARVKSHLKND